MPPEHSDCNILLSEYGFRNDATQTIVHIRDQANKQRWLLLNTLAKAEIKSDAVKQN